MGYCQGYRHARRLFLVYLHLFKRYLSIADAADVFLALYTEEQVQAAIKKCVKKYPNFSKKLELNKDCSPEDRERIKKKYEEEIKAADEALEEKDMYEERPPAKKTRRNGKDNEDEPVKTFGKL